MSHFNVWDFVKTSAAARRAVARRSRTHPHLTYAIVTSDRLSPRDRIKAERGGYPLAVGTWDHGDGQRVRIRGLNA